nr:hypothetical protein [Tanacetum cinerariifolium]
MCLYIDAEEHELGDLGKPANYKAALLDPEFDKWLNAMNIEMQFIKDNEVWVFVELPPNGKSVGSKWLFKKKTNKDGVVHTYKARLMAKGYTQTSGIDSEETFSSVADIRAIRILIAIVAYYDYEIWQMDVKTAFLNGYLNEDVYMDQLEGEAAYILGIKIYRDRSCRLIGLCQNAYIKKILKRYCMENSKRIPMKEKLKLSKSQGASTPAELKRIQNVSYASTMGSIMYAVRCTRPDVVFAQNVTSRFQQNPGDLHWTTVKNILKYLRNTKDMFLVYEEAEYIAAFDASKEVVWVRKFISGLGVVPTIEEPISMYCNNTGAIAIANESGITKGARHFRAKVHYLREVIEYVDIKLKKVHTDDNLADPFTKALAFPKHSKHTRNIGMLPASSLIDLDLNLFASSIGCQPSHFPCTYLGLPIRANMSRSANWFPLLERFKKRLSSWKAKSLSFGGRLTLSKSVLGSLGVYYFSNFKALKMITKISSYLRELLKLESLIFDLQITSDHDNWECLIDPSRNFTVKGMRNAKTNTLMPSNPCPTRWNKLVPIKVNSAYWRIENRRIPTMVNLDLRGIDLHSVRCSICDEDLETEEHLLVKCTLAKNTWRSLNGGTSGMCIWIT